MSDAPQALQRVTLRRLFRTLFLRGRSGRRPRGNMAPRSIGASLWVTLILYGLMGNMAFTFSRDSVMAFAASLHGVTFFLVTLYVSASAGEALFHKDEAEILMHRPITPHMILWAKVRVLLEITWWLAGAFNLVGLWYGAVSVPDAGWLFVVGHVVSVALEALLCVSFIVMVYELCLRWFGRERLDALMTTTQVALSAGGVLVWNLMPHAARLQGRTSLDLHAWWTWLLPPFWFAALDEVSTGHGTRATWPPALAGIGVTAGIAALAFGKLAASYGEGLVLLNEATPAVPEGRRTGRRWLELVVRTPLLTWWLRNPQVRASFTLTLAYLMRDREVKLRVYPQLASAFAIAFALKMNPHGAGGLAPCACLLAMIPVNALESLRYSQQWQAADMYRCAPMTGPGPLCDGARRAVLVFVAVPATLLFALIFAISPGMPGDLYPTLACLALLPVYARIPTWHGRGVPLSAPNEDMRPRRGLFYVALFIIAATVLGLAAFAETQGWLVYFFSFEGVVLVAIYLGARRKLASITWASLDAS